MLKHISFSNSLMMLSLALLPGLFVVSFPRAAQAQAIITDDHEATTIPDSPPDRRTDKLRKLELPQRRSPGGSRSASSIIQAPSRRESGSTRSLGVLAKQTSCNSSQESLTALLPRDLLGMTASTSPTLFFAMPPIPSSITVEFVLWDEQKQQIVYETTLKGNEQAGIMGVKLPSQAKGNDLKSKQQYHWYLSVICNNEDRANDIVVEGLLERVALNPALTQQLAQANPLEKVKIYQSQNLWQETLSTLVELKRDRPNDPTVIALWKQVLNSVDIDDAIALQSLQ